MRWAHAVKILPHFGVIITKYGLIRPHTPIMQNMPQIVRFLAHANSWYTTSRIKGRAIFRYRPSTKIFWRPSSFSAMFFSKKLSPVLKTTKIIARPKNHKNYRPSCPPPKLIARPFIREG